MKKLLSIMIMSLVLVSTSVVVKAEPKIIKQIGSWATVVNSVTDPIYGKTRVFVIAGGDQEEEGMFYLQFVIIIDESHRYIAQMNLVIPDGMSFTKNEVVLKADADNPIPLYMVIFPGTEKSLTTRSIKGDNVNEVMERIVEHKTLLVDTHLNSKRRILSFDLNGFTECALAADTYMNGY